MNLINSNLAYLDLSSRLHQSVFLLSCFWHLLYIFREERAAKWESKSSKHRDGKVSNRESFRVLTGGIKLHVVPPYEPYDVRYNSQAKCRHHCNINDLAAFLAGYGVWSPISERELFRHNVEYCDHYSDCFGLAVIYISVGKSSGCYTNPNTAHTSQENKGEKSNPFGYSP